MIEFRAVKDWTEENFTSLLRWQNDSSLRHLHLPCFDPNKSFTFTREIAKQDNNPNRWMIFVDGRAVGHASIAIDHPAAISRPPVAWVGLVLGERDVWGTGVADRAVEHMLAAARACGAKIMEAGVFSFNERSLRFWKRQGFEEFYCIPRFTYWDGKWWADIRFRLQISKLPLK